MLSVSGAASDNDPMNRREFVDYWYKGKAEISRFELKQARYGEVHDGSLVFVFVTEDFLPDKQVKADSTDRSKTGALPVLKLNQTRNFHTGIYPYSAMTSTFTPVDVSRHPRSLKSTTSMQEWCGHVYTQLNLRGRSYAFQTFSYFEQEGDQSFKLDAELLEDEVWARIRLDPDSLPTGRIKVIPGGQDQRFSHRPFRVEKAKASLEKGDGGRRRYRLSYPDLDRDLVIEFQEAFPHRIESFRDQRGGLETVATRTHTILDPYWQHNRKRDAGRRKSLGL